MVQKAQTYLEYNFSVSPLQPANEILIAELGYIGFESFVETETGVVAYIQKEECKENMLNEVNILNADDFDITYSVSEIEQVNWNAEWEKNFSPIEVDGKCRVCAPFHSKSDFQYEIVIEPKMSFGTGHHETTFMMLQYILENDFEGKSVLDMGCGTAVLAILASLRDAHAVDAIDIDPWCYENSQENIQRNQCQDILVSLGDVSMLQDRKYDIVLANINRNILLNDLPKYVQSLNPSGTIYLSGFYDEDLQVITDCCNNLGLEFVDSKKKNKWVAAKFKLSDK